VSEDLTRRDDLTNDLTRFRELFFKYVWDHTEDDFYSSFDFPPERAERIVEKVKILMENIEAPGDELIGLLTCLVSHENRPDIEFLSFVVQIAGYTQNKILSDLRAKGHKAPSTFESLIGGKELKLHPSWKVAAAMLISKLVPILKNLSSQDISHRLRALDLATYPGFIRQQRAKYVGHYAEKKLAELLDELGIPFAPYEKKVNPLTRDVTLKGQSFDLVIPSETDPKIAVKSTVHTANTGQYGESKDKLEIKEAKEALKDTGVILVALADGVGFRSNADALNGLFEYSDEVVQFATLWKVPAMAVRVLGLGRLVVVFSEEHKQQEEDFKDFVRKWGVLVYHEKFESAEGVSVGNVAKVRIERDHTTRGS